MLFVSLVGSAVLLLVANGLARFARNAGAAIFGICALVIVSPFFLGIVFPPVWIQALLFCVALLVWGATRRGPGFFLGLSCGATVVAYGLATMVALSSEREYARLRLKYPYESMEARVPAPREEPGSPTLLPEGEERLCRMEERISGQRNEYREFQLRLLHEEAVSVFVNSPGFGIARMSHPNEGHLAVNPRGDSVPRQPGSPSTSTESPGEWEPVPAGAEKSLGSLLEASLLDFVNLRGFGYFKDRQHVAGFEPHQFSEVPEPAGRWKVRRLELVGLLLHDRPEVYVSPDLPRMDRLEGLTMRPLDRFEKLGLTGLRRGEDIVAAQGPEGVRMLGAVRSTKQCVACHGGERGALLGAFSYDLRAEERP